MRLLDVYNEPVTLREDSREALRSSIHLHVLTSVTLQDSKGDTKRRFYIDLLDLFILLHFSVSHGADIVSSFRESWPCSGWCMHPTG